MLNNEKDNLEICLIRDGHRAVLEAEERLCQQQAEITRLQSILLCFMDEVNKWENKHGLDISELPLIPIKNEAEKIKNQIELKSIEEFAERLKEQITTRIVELKAIKSKYVKENYKCLGCDYIAKIRGEIEFLESLKEFIDNILKEMAGEE